MKTGGNLAQILPPGINPGEAGEQLYSFNQRNLLTQYQVGAGSSVYNTLAEYSYDGGSNRLQQIDSSGTTPITTTYTNDNAGLSQVLVSNDGTITTLNLFGLDLIQQDDGSQTRTLLVDGLGSARVEMVGDTLETTTTFEPYGKLLMQNGSSGTTYGYTGEQYDASTNFVYLRARYYNPNLKVFMSRDPFPGWMGLPASQHGYSYVHNNPVNLTDPTGKFVLTPTAGQFLQIVAGASAAAPLALAIGGGVVVGIIVHDVIITRFTGNAAITSMIWEVMKTAAENAGRDILITGACTVAVTLATQHRSNTQTKTETLDYPLQATPQGTMVPWDDDDDDDRTAYIIGAGAFGEADGVIDEVAAKYERVIVNDIDPPILNVAERLFRQRNPLAVHVEFRGGDGAFLERLDNGEIFIVAPNRSLHKRIPTIADNVLGFNSTLYVATDFNFIGLPIIGSDVYSSAFSQNRYNLAEPIRFGASGIRVGPRAVLLNSLHFKDGGNLLGTITRK